MLGYDRKVTMGKTNKIKKLEDLESMKENI